MAIYSHFEFLLIIPFRVIIFYYRYFIFSYKIHPTWEVKLSCLVYKVKCHITTSNIWLVTKQEKRKQLELSFISMVFSSTTMRYPYCKNTWEFVVYSFYFVEACSLLPLQDFFHVLMLDFVKGLVCIYWDDHVIFCL